MRKLQAEKAATLILRLDIHFNFCGPNFLDD